MFKQSVQEAKKLSVGNTGLGAFMKAIFLAYITTMIAFNLFAFILVYTDFPEKYIVTSVAVATIASIFFSSSAAAKGAKSRGWLNGGIVGLFYMLILYFISSLTYRNFSFNRYVFLMFVIGILTGSIGGILGINIRAGARRKYKR